MKRNIRVALKVGCKWNLFLNPIGCRCPSSTFREICGCIQFHIFLKYWPSYSTFFCPIDKKQFHPIKSDVNNLLCSSYIITVYIITVYHLHGNKKKKAYNRKQCICMTNFDTFRRSEFHTIQIKKLKYFSAFLTVFLHACIKKESGYDAGICKCWCKCWWSLN